jgi:hypothetical protein
MYGVRAVGGELDLDLPGSAAATIAAVAVARLPEPRLREQPPVTAVSICTSIS